MRTKVRLEEEFFWKHPGGRVAIVGRQECKTDDTLYITVGGCIDMSETLPEDDASAVG